MTSDCTPESLLQSYLPTIHDALKNTTNIPDPEIIDWSLKTAYHICHTVNTDATFFLEFHTRLNRWLHDSGYLFPKISFALPNSDPRPPVPVLPPGQGLTSIKCNGTNVEIIDAVIRSFEN